MSRAALVVACLSGLVSASVHAAAAPVADKPPETPQEVPQDLKPAVRIQRRFVEKRHRFAIYAGFAYIGRGDFYRSPGIEVAASFYVIEQLAVDLRGAWLFSTPTSELTDLVNRTGYVADARAEQATVMAGLRWSIGYAKIRFSEKYTLHFEPQLFFYAGIHVAAAPFAGTSVGPIGEVGIGFLLFVTPRLQMRIDAGLTLEGEQRTTYVPVVGGYPVLALGVMF